MSKARYIIAALAALPVLSCMREIAVPEDCPVGFSVIVEDLAQPEEAKSVLSGDDIETKVTSLTLGLYCNGAIKDRLYFGPGGDMGIGDFASYTLNLAFYYGCEVVALANMGDMRSSLPAADSGIASINYRIPGYTSPSGSCVQARGIPMAGRIRLSDEDSFVSESLHGTTVHLPLRRLLAKVAVDLAVEWPGYIQSVKIRNLNAVLKPFAELGSAAASSADILAEEEIETGPDAKEGTFVFYVPENRQGSVDGITASSDKSADNSLLSGRTAVLTYMEVLVEGKGDGVDKQEAVGSITYRSYLGDNATSSFDIVGNRRYTWTVNYLPDGMANQDWKHENALSWFMPRYYFYPAGPTKLQWTEEKSAYLLRIYDSYENGVLTSRERGEYPNDYHNNRDDYEIVDVTGFTCYYHDPSDESVRDDDAVITVSHPSYTTMYFNVYGQGEGTRRLHFLINDNYGHHDVWGDFYCTGYLNQVTITGSAATARPGEPITFTASVKRLYANGNKTVISDNVSSHYTFPFSKENASGEYKYYNTWSMTTQSGNQVTFTPTQEGNYQVFVSYADPETGVSSNSDHLYFTVDSGVHLELSASPASTQVGSYIQLTLYQVAANGTRTNVTTSVGSSGWKAYMADGTTINSNISVNSSGRATVSAATSGVIRATYGGRTSNDVDVEWKPAPTLSVSPPYLSWTASQKYVSKYAYVTTNSRDDMTMEVTGADASDLYYKLENSAETSGTYAGRYKLTAFFRTANSSATAKSAVVTLRAGTRTATLTCTQDGVESLSVSPTELEWEWNESAAKTATITTNLSGLYIFTGGDAASAIAVTRSGSTIYVSWTGSNTYSAERTATVTVANASTIAAATATAVLTVRQAGKPFTPTLSVDKTSLSWVYDKYGSGNAKTIKVTSNIPLESLSATVSGTNASDVSYSLDESGTDGVYDLIVYFISRNNGSADRTAKIIVSGTGTYSAVTPVEIGLIQTYYPSVTINGTGILEWNWDQYGQTSVKTVSFKTSVSRENIFCEVSTGQTGNVGYAISSTPDSSGYYTLSVWWNSKNTSAQARDADIVFRSSDGRPVTVNKTVTVRQHGKPDDPVMTVSASEFIWSHAKHGYDNAETVTVTTNFPVSDLTYSKSGNGELNYQVSQTGTNTATIMLWWASANEVSIAREGELFISGHGLSATLFFKQTAKPGFTPGDDDYGGEINPDF